MSILLSSEAQKQSNWIFGFIQGKVLAAKQDRKTENRTNKKQFCKNTQTLEKIHKSLKLRMIVDISVNFEVGLFFKGFLTTHTQRSQNMSSHLNI